ncbi:MAG: hypothetical protein ACRES5_05735 [Pseudomonas sp.]
MSEIIGFQQRMRFTALRTFDADLGPGGVVAVFFAPSGGKPIHGSPPPTNEAPGLRLVAGRASWPTDPPTATGRQGDALR